MKPHVLVALLVISWVVAWLPGSALAEGDAAAGKALFDANCSSCHGVSGKGDGPIGAALVPAPRDFTLAAFAFDANQNGVAGEDVDLTQVIQNGAMKYGGSPLMAPWPSLTDDQVTDLIAHIRSLEAEEEDAAEIESAPEEETQAAS